MDVACDCDALSQIELAVKQNDADLESNEKIFNWFQIIKPCFLNT